MKSLFGALFGIGITAIVLGCGDAGTKENVGPATSTAPSAEGQRFLLAAEPAGAQGVIDAKKDAKDGEEILVVGRIGGDVKPWVEGRASFVIVDTSLTPCSERPGDDCETPWDYCCDTDQLPKAKAAVKFTTADGQTIGTDARALLGVKELDTVVIQGKSKRDDAGNLTILATGFFVKR